MSIDNVGLEWALKFHETYERLAPEFGYETRTDTRQFESESKNGRLMIAVCGELIPQAQAAAEAELTRLRARLAQDGTRYDLVAEHEARWAEERQRAERLAGLLKQTAMWVRIYRDTLKQKSQFPDAIDGYDAIEPQVDAALAAAPAPAGSEGG